MLEHTIEQEKLANEKLRKQLKNMKDQYLPTADALEEEDEIGEGGVEEGRLTGRSLYVDLVPPSNGYGFRDLDDSKYGVCSDGWDTDSCSAAVLSLYNCAVRRTPILDMFLSVAPVLMTSLLMLALVL